MDVKYLKKISIFFGNLPAGERRLDSAENHLRISFSAQSMLFNEHLYFLPQYNHSILSNPK